MKFPKVRLKHFALFVAATVLFGSCQDQEAAPDDMILFDYEYFPVGVGKYWIYQLDSVVVQQQGAFLNETTSFIREEITDSYFNAQGDEVFVLRRSISESLNGSFRTQDIWTVEVTEFEAFRVEENLRFRKMVFPLNLDRTWEGNLFDNLTVSVIGGESMWEYKDWGDYTVVNRAMQKNLNGLDFEDVVAIEQADHDFVIERRYSVEYYAPDVGLIEREMEVLDSQCDCPNLTWLEKATSGYTLKQTLIEYN